MCVRLSVCLIRVPGECLCPVRLESSEFGLAVHGGAARTYEENGSALGGVLVDTPFVIPVLESTYLV